MIRFNYLCSRTFCNLNLKNCLKKSDKLFFYKHKMKLNLLRKEEERLKVTSDMKVLMDSSKLWKLADLGFNEKDLILYEIDPKYYDMNNDSVNPLESYVSLIIPFKSNSEIKNKLTRFNTGTVRIGKILELIDYISGRVCYKHFKSNNKNEDNNTVMVTACVDGFENLNLNHSTEDDLVLEAYLNYVGTSSMEVQVDIHSNNSIICSCYVTMVARQNNVKTKYKLLQLAADSENLIVKKELAKLRIEKRKRKAEFVKSNLVPNNEDFQALHNYIILRKDSPNCVYIKNTLVSKMELVHNESRNIHGKMFGGVIMREAYELAYICAYNFDSSNYPVLFHIFDTQFYSPVDIGSSLAYNSKIVYLENNIIIITVTVDNTTYDKETGDKIIKRTNEFNVAFLINNYENKCIIPESYFEAIEFINGKKLLNEILVV